MAIANTKAGTFQGVEDGAVSNFLGIRYAEPPTGKNRFQPPQPLESIGETYDATTFGTRNFQVAEYEGLEADPEIFGAQSEDCLFLNVYAPSNMVGSKPVMVWIHGGAFISGSGNQYVPTRIVAENDVIVVTINYRLGIFGFIDLSQFGPEYSGSANLGLQDQIAALRWVQDNIAAFGGDPDNVTIWGESAGAASVFALLGAPAAEGLFHKAAPFSGTETITPPLNQIALLKAALEIESDEDCLNTLKSLPAKELSELQEKSGFYGGPSLDGTILTQRSMEAVQQGWASQIPILTGNTLDEGTMLAPPYAANEQVGMATLFALGPLVSNDDGTPYRDYLQSMVPDGDLKKQLTHAWLDVFRSSALRVASAASQYGAGGWVYSFEVPTDHEWGITHYADVPFAFNWIEEGNPALFVHPPTPENREIAQRWSDTVIAFARTGSPNGGGLPEWHKFQPDSYASMRISHQPELIERADADKLELYDVA
ncbi:MAG: carboxylesterase family protein [Pseudomonadota bacterium]